ncbi:DUF5644 domain-containing protein [Sulfurospirillum sp. 1307]
MECKLTLQVFRFNHKTDYLPYYRKHVVKIDEQKSVADLLAMVSENELDFGYEDKEFSAIKINNKSLFVSTKIKEVVDFFGNELTLEPLSPKRVEKDFIINTDDFNKKFDLLDAYVEGSDRKIYKSYIREYYSSPVVNLSDEYLGDALFAFAYDMIEKYPNMKDKILNAIALQDGIWLHVNISNKLYPINFDLERKVEFLKNKIIKQETPANKYVAKLQEISKSF